MNSVPGFFKLLSLYCSPGHQGFYPIFVFYCKTDFCQGDKKKMTLIKFENLFNYLS